MFQKKRIWVFICCTMVLAIILLNLTGCGGSGDPPVKYRICKVETYYPLNSTFNTKTTFSYDTSGNPSQWITTGHFTSEHSITVAFDKGKLMSLQVSDSSGVNIQKVEFEYNGAGQLFKKLIYTTGTEGTSVQHIIIDYDASSGKKFDETLYSDSGTVVQGYTTYRYEGERLTKKYHYKSKDDTTSYTSYDYLEYDSNENIYKSSNYAKEGDTTPQSYSVYTWERGTSTVDLFEVGL